LFLDGWSFKVEIVVFIWSLNTAAFKRRGMRDFWQSSCLPKTTAFWAVERMDKTVTASAVSYSVPYLVVFPAGSLSIVDVALYYLIFTAVFPFISSIVASRWAAHGLQFSASIRVCSILFCMFLSLYIVHTNVLFSLGFVPLTYSYVVMGLIWVESYFCTVRLESLFVYCGL